MERRLIVAAVLMLAFMPFVASAQISARQKNAAVHPPDLKHMLPKASAPTESPMEDLPVFQPEIPLGPVDVLKGYEDGMVLVTQKLSNDLASILDAKHGNQITPERAEYLINERYQIAMMQHQVLSALHESLEQDLEAAGPGRSVSPSKSDAAAALQLPPSRLDSN